MGADSGMYAGAWRTLANARFIDWPDFQGERSLEEVADRLIRLYKIPDGAIVAGSSLGGMVACEIARLRSLEHLVLIGSAKKKEEVGDLLRGLHSLVDLAPLPFIQQVSGKIPTDITRMFSQAQAPFIRAMCRAIFEWRGANEASARILRIHGSHDHVIPLPADVDLILEGGHLIAMTHPEACVAFIQTGQSTKSENPAR